VARLTDIAQALVQVRDAALAAAPGGSCSCRPAAARARTPPNRPVARRPGGARRTLVPDGRASPALALQARRRGAYALVERGAWLAQAGAPLAVLVEATRA